MTNASGIVISEHRPQPRGGRPPMLVIAAWRGASIEAARMVDPVDRTPIGPYCLSHDERADIISELERDYA